MIMIHKVVNYNMSSFIYLDCAGTAPHVRHAILSTRHIDSSRCCSASFCVCHLHLLALLPACLLLAGDRKARRDLPCKHTLAHSLTLRLRLTELTTILLHTFLLRSSRPRTHTHPQKRSNLFHPLPLPSHK